jgi:hypothetical protein
MVAKKKSPIHKKTEPLETPTPMEEKVVEERRPAVTQVVEVVEEDAGGQTPVPSAQVEESPQEHADVAVQNDEVTSETVEASSPLSAAMASDEEELGKRKELVDELFQKHDKQEVAVAPEISMHTRRASIPLIVWAIGIIIICLLIGGTLMVATGKVKSFPSVKFMATPTPTPSQTPKATPTPTPLSVKRADIKIQVVNGGGKVGAATKMKKFLEDKGYTVSGTSNADSYTFDKTQISVKSVNETFIPLLEQDLKDSYTLASSDATLTAKAAYDVRVTVGKE